MAIRIGANIAASLENNASSNNKVEIAWYLSLRPVVSLRALKYKIMEARKSTAERESLMPEIQAAVSTLVGCNPKNPAAIAATLLSPIVSKASR